MIGCMIKSTFGFALRFAVVSILIKSSLEIISINENTPKLFVERTGYLTGILRDKMSINFDHDTVLRYVTLH